MDQYDDCEIEELCRDNGFVVGDFRDPETGVHYLVTRGTVSGSGIAITPRLNSDGNVYTTDSN